MTCEHHPYYKKHCAHCMVRRIKSLRGPDAKTSRRLQDQYLETLTTSMVRQVKEILAKERNQ